MASPPAPKAGARALGALLVVGAVRTTPRPRWIVPDPADITLATLERTLARLAKDADIVDLAAMRASIAAGERDRPAVLVWFEGHGRSIADVAAPALARMGLPFVVETRGGAGGVIGVVAMCRAPADGYTLSLTGAGTITAGPHLRALPYDALGLAHITRLVRMPFIVSPWRALPSRPTTVLTPAAARRSPS